MMDPSSNAEVLSVNPGTVGAAAGGACAFAGAAAAMDIPSIAQIETICVNFILNFSPFKFAGDSIVVTGQRVMYASRPFQAMML
jgi:hypothetical protein